MAEQCRKCGSELFFRQKFCRECGQPSDDLQESLPTRMMGPSPDSFESRGAANTAPTPRSETTPVYAPPQFYEPSIPMQPFPHTPPAPPKKSRSPWILLMIVIAALVIGGAVVGGRFIAGIVREAVTDAAKVERFDQPQVFPLNQLNAAVALKTYNGSITVETWDQPQAEVRVIRRGPSNEAIDAIPIEVVNNAGNLTFEAREGENRTSVELRVKLPRSVGTLSLVTINGNVRLSDLDGVVEAETLNGNILFSDVSGVARAVSTNGNVKGEIGAIAQDRPVEISTTNGNIDIEFQSEINANLRASTNSGSIRVDDAFPGIQVRRTRGSAQASGRIGSGGPDLILSTTNGNITVRR
jgi:hypothetical protein